MAQRAGKHHLFGGKMPIQFGDSLLQLERSENIVEFLDSFGRVYLCVHMTC